MLHAFNAPLMSNKRLLFKCSSCSIENSGPKNTEPTSRTCRHNSDGTTLYIITKTSSVPDCTRPAGTTVMCQEQHRANTKNVSAAHWAKRRWRSCRHT